MIKQFTIALQGKFIRIHFGPNGKIAGADIETCKSILSKYLSLGNLQVGQAFISASKRLHEKMTKLSYAMIILS